MSPDECAALIGDTEQRGFAPAPVTTGFGFVMMPELRNNTRVMLDDVALAERLWARLKHRTELEGVDVWQPIGLNERFRFYRYGAGQAFRWHRDGAFIRNGSEQSLLTFMIYLNDGFVGGATEFEDTAVQPAAGHALLFRHGLRHQGAEVTRGTKYVLRSDVMFRRRAA
jgi:predicted 2-oxoglutarate/Fe(II)-dependent dioxygenase YbiX